MKRALFIAALGGVAALATLLPACKSAAVIARVTNRITAPEGGKAYVVATEKTAFYRYGPKQGSGPDGELPKDTVVNLIRNSFGFSKIQVPSTGQQGFVSSEDIVPATPTLLASLSTPPPVANITTAATSATAPAPVTEDFDLRATDPNVLPPPEDLPPPDLPPASNPTPQ